MYACAKNWMDKYSSAHAPQHTTEIKETQMSHEAMANAEIPAMDTSILRLVWSWQEASFILEGYFNL